MLARESFIIDEKDGELIYGTPRAPGPSVVFFSHELLEDYRKDPRFEVMPATQGGMWVRAVEDEDYELVLQLKPGKNSSRDEVVWTWLSELSNLPDPEIARLQRYNVKPPRVD